MKKAVSLLLILILSFSIICVDEFSMRAQAASLTQSEFESKLSSARSKYPNGCNSDTYTWYVQGSVVGYQCHGYARWLSYYVWGSDFRNGNGTNWTRYEATSSNSQIDKLVPGDVIRYRSSTSKTYNHTIFVTSISGDTVYFTDCNSDGNCTVKWDRSFSKSTLSQYLVTTLYNSGNEASSTGRGYIAHYTLNNLNTVHEHNYSTTGYESSHPHKIYKKCSCGDWYYTGEYKYLDASCDECWEQNKVDVWVANVDESGEISKGIVCNRYQFWFKLYSNKTGNLYNSYGDVRGYKSKITVYNPDGTELYSYEYDDSDYNWIRATPEYLGEYKVRIELTGNITADYYEYFTVESDFSISFQADEISITEGQSKNIIVNSSGSYPVGSKVRYEIDQNIATYTANGGGSFTITAVKAGTTTFKILCKDSNGTVFAQDSIIIKVQASAYSLTYNANGGSGAPSAQTGNTTYTISSTVPTRSGYTFLGWSKSSSASSPTYKPGDSITLTANTTLYAIWKAASSISLGSSYSVSIAFSNQEVYYCFTPASTGNYTFESTGSLDTKVYVYNSSFTELGNNDDGGSDHNFKLTLNLTSGNKYYIKVRAYNSNTGSTSFSVTANAYTLSYNANGGSGAPSAQTGSTSYTISSTVPTRSGYTFLGWSKSSSASSPTYKPGDSITLTANTTLYAIWKAASSISLGSSYSVSIAFSNQEVYYCFTPASTGNYTFESTGSLDTKVYVYNSSFTELGNNDDGGSDHNFKLTLNLTSGNKYYVKIRAYNSNTGSTSFSVTANTYTLSYNANGGSGAPSAQTGSTTYYVSSTVPTRSGYTFLGWSKSSSASSASYTGGDKITISENTTLYAVWKKNETPVTSYTLSYNANGGSGAPSAQTGNTTYTISSTVPTKSGYTFLGWSKSSSASSASYTGGDKITISENTTLYAVWKENPTTSSDGLIIKTKRVVLDTQEYTMGASTITIDEKYLSSSYSIVATASDDRIINLGTSGSYYANSAVINIYAKNVGECTITVKVMNKAKTVTYEEETIEVVVRDTYYQTISAGYKCSYPLKNYFFKDVEIIDSWSDNESVVTADNMYISTVGTGSTNVYAVDADGNMQEFHIDVSYDFFDWLIIILLFGWIWYI